MQEFTNIDGSDEFEPIKAYNHYKKTLEEIEREQQLKTPFENDNPMRDAEMAEDYFRQQSDFAVDVPVPMGNPLTDDEFDFNSTLHSMIPDPWDEEESENVVNFQGS
ncbi:MAG: hypothetical protein FWE13_03635 [Firmicutes bacterium]|nr:hypothetical protein [Bacillota bacterium]